MTDFAVLLIWAAAIIGLGVLTWWLHRRHARKLEAMHSDLNELSGHTKARSHEARHEHTRVIDRLMTLLTGRK